jgi:hypothetical protein
VQFNISLFQLSLNISHPKIFSPNLWFIDIHQLSSQLKVGPSGRRTGSKAKNEMHPAIPPIKKLIYYFY